MTRENSNGDGKWSSEKNWVMRILGSIIVAVILLMLAIGWGIPEKVHALHVEVELLKASHTRIKKDTSEIKGQIHDLDKWLRNNCKGKLE